MGTFNVIRLCTFAMKDNPLNALGERGCIVNTSAVSAFEGNLINQDLDPGLDPDLDHYHLIRVPSLPLSHF